MDSVRQQIVSAIDARLKGILISGGYETNAGQHVFDWRVEETEEDVLPALIYRDTTVESSVDSFSAHAHKMTVTILALATDSTPMAEIRKIIADVDKAIGVDHTWGNLAIMTERVGDTSEIEMAEKKYAASQITIAVTFRTVAWDAYTKV